MATNVTPVGGTEQDLLVTVVVNGTTLGVFDSSSGGTATAPSVKHRAGGQKNQQSFPTQPVYSNVMVRRVNQMTRDWELIRQLKPLAGLVPMSVTVQPLDATRNSYGNAQTATGLLLSVKEPTSDSDSDALQTWELEMSVDGWQ